MFFRRRSGTTAPEPNIFVLIATIVLTPTALFAVLFLIGTARRLLG